MNKKIIAIEGSISSDDNFIRALFKSMDIDNKLFKFESLGGQGDFEKRLEKILKLELRKGDSLAFICDAENKQPTTHLKIFQKNLKGWIGNTKREKLGLKIPNELGKFEDCETQIGIYVLPSEGEKGCIEDLGLKLFRDQPSKECVDNFFACIAKDREIKKHLSKKKLSIQLALYCCSQERDFVHTLGLAAQKGYLNLKQELPELDKLKNFLAEFAKS